MAFLRVACVFLTAASVLWGGVCLLALSVVAQTAAGGPGGMVMVRMSPQYGAWTQRDLIQMPDVQTHLRLSRRQKQDLAERLRPRAMPERTFPARPAALPVPPSAEELRRREEDRKLAQQDIEPAVFRILTPKQFARLREMELQWRGPWALADPNVAKRIRLSQAHAQEIRHIVEQATRERTHLARSYAHGNRGIARDQYFNPSSPSRVSLKSIKSRAEERIRKVLDEGEAARWKAARGRHYRFPYERHHSDWH